MYPLLWGTHSYQRAPLLLHHRSSHLATKEQVWCAVRLKVPALTYEHHHTCRSAMLFSTQLKWVLFSTACQYIYTIDGIDRRFAQHYCCTSCFFEMLWQSMGLSCSAALLPIVQLLSYLLLLCNLHIARSCYIVSESCVVYCAR